MSRDRIKKGIKVVLTVVICWLKIYIVLLAVASILSEIELKTGSNVLLAVVICLLNIGLVLLAVASIFITNMSGIKIAWRRRGSFENLHYKSEIKQSEKRDSQTQSKATMIIW